MQQPVTKRKTRKVAAEEALRLSEATKTAILETALDCIVTIDHLGFVLDWNPAAERTFGYSRAEAIGREMAELIIPAAFQPMHRAGLARAVATGKDAMAGKRFEIVAHRKNGAELPVELAITRVAVKPRPLFTGHIRDISDRKKAEANLLQLNQELEQRVTERTLELTLAKQDLVKALAQEKELSVLKSSFVNLVSHEFRTPLSVIMSASDLLGKYFDRLRPEQRRDHLSDIHHATRQMTNLMDEVLLLGCVEAGRMECRPVLIDLAGFCDRLVEEQLSATNRKCPLELSVGKLPSPAMGDEGLLRHILGNLVGNAVKYSPVGSPVRLTVLPEGDDALFTVTDSGIGIPLEDQGRLFEAFHRARNVGETPGTGLGLVIVKRCVELHGGHISFSSEAGQGTTFVVRLKLFASNSGGNPAAKGRPRKNKMSAADVPAVGS